jgi:hypothetical protein
VAAVDEKLDVLGGLRRVRALIDTEDKWTTRAYARDRASGDVVSLEADTPVGETCFCLSGAVFRALDDDSRLRSAVWSHLSFHFAAFGGVIKYNDEHTHAQVLAELDAAIEGAQVCKRIGVPLPLAQSAAYALPVDVSS